MHLNPLLTLYCLVPAFPNLMLVLLPKYLPQSQQLPIQMQNSSEYKIIITKKYSFTMQTNPKPHKTISSLSKLIPKINNYTKLHIYLLTYNKITFQISWHYPKFKTVAFQLIFEDSEVVDSHFEITKVAKIVGEILLDVNPHFINFFNSQQKLDKFCQQIWFKDKQNGSLTFSQIIITEGIKNYSQIFKWTFCNLKFHNISFKESLSIFEILRVVQYTNSQEHLHDNLGIEFNLQHYTDEQLLQIISLWAYCGKKDIESKTKGEVKSFGYPFPILKGKTSINRNETIFFKHKNLPKLRLTKLKHHGKLITYKGDLSHPAIMHLLSLLLSQNSPHDTLELELDKIAHQPDLLNLIEYLFTNQFPIKYLIKLSYQIQITPCRLLLNTVHLAPQSIRSIFKLMRLPGHYQFVCYSSIQYFHEIVEIFKEKPLVKFNLFLPISQFDNQRSNLIKKMENHSNKLRNRVYAYSGMLKDLASVGWGYFGVNCVFYMLMME